jgi:hypothetical protein
MVRGARPAFEGIAGCALRTVFTVSTAYVYIDRIGFVRTDFTGSNAVKWRSGP